MSSTLHRVAAGMGPYYDPDFADVLCLVQDVDPSNILLDQSPSPRSVTKASSTSFSSYGLAPRGNGRVLSVSSTGEVWRMVGDSSWTFFHSTAGSRPTNKLTLEMIAKAPTTNVAKVYIKPAGLNVSGRTSGNVFTVYLGADQVGVVGPERVYGSTESQAIRVINISGMGGTWVYVKAWYDLTNNTIGVEANGQTSSGDDLQSGSYNRQWNNNRCDVYADMHYSAQLFAVRVTKGVRPMERQLYSLPFPVFGGTVNTQGDSAPLGPGQHVMAPGDTWIVPAGITEISAVCVGCKLAVAGVDKVSATWPVLGDGGGKGGAGGAGNAVTVEKPWSGPWAGPGPAPVTYTTTYYPGGGGGAGGYTGDGGDGSPASGGTYIGSASGGGGGGGKPAYPGGGVGLRGEGMSGLTTVDGPGSVGSPGGAAAGAGIGGVGGDPYQYNGGAGANLAWKNSIPVTPGQAVTCTLLTGGRFTGAAARIIWGSGRSFPDSAGDV